MTLSPDQQSRLLDLARVTIRERLCAPPLPMPDLSDEVFCQPAGCFVTLHRISDHRLRGCIGYLQAVKSLKGSVEEMAAATLEDPRFESCPVTAEELPGLELEITLISPLEQAANPLDFDLESNGIVLKFAGRSGCFLPQVARDTGWDKPTLLRRLCTEKMGVEPDAWKQQGANLFRFTATIVGPEPFIRPAP